MMSASATLRVRTTAAHARVDGAFSAYDLGDRIGYRKFLIAHAKALPAAECVVADEPSLPPLRARTPLLTGDVTAMGATMPKMLPLVDHATAAYAWGVMYVIEGSRLGGSILAVRVAKDLPATYLRAEHLPGEWRDFRRALDTRAQQHDAAWIEEAASGAIACFDLYWRAALR